MIVGNGDIASVLPDRSDLLFFAAGVSNSQETDESEYARERQLLIAQPSGRHLVYFSTLSIFQKEGRYQTHKRLMESVVKENFTHWTIVRLGNILWGNNPHTIINAFREQYRADTRPVFQDVWRYLVDVEEFVHWIGMIPEFNCEMNITGKPMRPIDIWRTYVGHRESINV